MIAPHLNRSARLEVDQGSSVEESAAWREIVDSQRLRPRPNRIRERPGVRWQRHAAHRYRQCRNRFDERHSATTRVVTEQPADPERDQHFPAHARCAGQRTFAAAVHLRRER